MLNYNKVILGGVIAKKPKGYKIRGSDTFVLNILIMTRSYYYEKKKVKKEKTDIHNAVLFGEVAKKSVDLKKGDAVFVEGRLQTKSWKDKDRGRNYRNEIVVSDIWTVLCERYIFYQLTRF